MTIYDKYADIAWNYAQDVVHGDIPACIYVRQACQRFIDDFDRDDLESDPAQAHAWCSFLERLPHVKGQWASRGEDMTLSPWQVFCVVNIFGWKKNGRRRFREVYIEVPRKNGKTFWLAGIGLGMLTIEREHGAEVYCGATSEQQAWEVFRPAKQIAERMPDLRRKFGVEVNAKTLVRLSDMSRFAPVIGNPGDGASPSCGIADEFHEHKNSDLVDTFVTGMGAREQPLMLYITTAGSDMGGPCYEKRDDVKKILSGSVEDDAIFGIIYTIDEKDQWDTVEAQKKANPNYGVSVDPEFLKGQLAQARRSATKQTAYKTKHLNLWVGAKAAWMNMLAYQVCRKKKLTLESFKARPCFVGIDLASTQDIASMAVVFPPASGGKWAVFVRHFLPEDRILEGGNTRYKAWHADGWLEATPGNVIDYAYIEDELKALKDVYQVTEVAFDPFQATQFSTRMMDEGFPMVQYGATVKNFSSPMKELEALILKKSIEFQRDPVLHWMFGNVTAQEDKKENIFPNKESKKNKIDGVVAIIMAMGRAMLQEDPGSVYDKRDIRQL